MKMNDRRLNKNCEIRAAKEGESRKIEGYAALYDSRSDDLGGFTEIIRNGAFDGAKMDDVRLLKNHDPNLVFARTKSGTLSLSVDERGLKFEFDAPPTASGDELLYDVRSGNVDQASFAFTLSDSDDADEVVRENGTVTRFINRFGEIFDASIVTYPAYNETVVSARSKKAVENKIPKNWFADILARYMTGASTGRNEVIERMSVTLGKGEGFILEMLAGNKHPNYNEVRDIANVLGVPLPDLIEAAGFDGVSYENEIRTENAGILVKVRNM